MFHGVVHVCWHAGCRLASKNDVQIHCHEHTCAYTHARARTHTHAHTHMHAHTHTHAHTHARTHTHTHTHTHTYTGAIAVTSGTFSDPSQSPTISGVQCTGAETDLLSCYHSNFIDRSICGPSDDAGVVCQGSSSTPDNCHANIHSLQLLVS